MFQTFRGAFADIHIDILRTVTEGEMIAVHCHVTGTHTGRELGVDATQNRVEFEGVTIARVVNGQLREGWNCFDFLTMYQQLDDAADPADGVERKRPGFEIAIFHGYNYRA